MALDVESIIACTMELAAIPAPTGDEGRRGDAVAERFARSGLRVTRDAVGNVVARTSVAAADPSAPATVFSAHLDTVFDAATDVTPRRVGDRLLGPGVGDNTVAVATLIAVAAEIAAAPPRDPVVLAATVGEEGLGDLRGAKHLLETVPARAFVAVEGQMLDELVTGAVGSVRLSARFTGAGGHSWGDRGTPSAAHAALRAGAAAIEAVPADRHLNVGVVRAGTTVNAIAAGAELLIDLRDRDPHLLRATAARVRQTLERHQQGIRIDVRQVGDRPAGQMPADHALLGAVRDLRADLGLPRAEELPSSTESNAAFGAGVPTVCVGITHGGDAHRLTEYIDLPPLAAGAEYLLRLVRELPAVR